MEEDNKMTPWTSVDVYYKGFHIKKSWPENVSRVQLMSEIDSLIQAGFKPSWNEDTNKTSVPTPKSEPEDTYTVPCKTCGGATTYKTGVSKTTGKPWKAYFCNTNKEHKPYFVK